MKEFKAEYAKPQQRGNLPTMPDLLAGDILN